ncbi:MAG: sensor domain-containing diguanylate cyclase, partial [Thermoanaerobaculia bacterium]|nr:sensor domain-containing diguanylate cyclase [Thermoanaerobaculia bacterium]
MKNNNPGHGKLVISDVVIVANGSGEILFANRGTSEVFALDPAELIGENLSVLIPSLEREEIDHLTESAGKGISVPKVNARHADGHLIEVDVVCSEYTEEGERRIVALIRDRTARTKLEQRLTEMEQEHRLLFHRNLAGVYRATPDGRIFDCNDACAKILGRTDREAYLSDAPASPFMESAELESIVERLRDEEETISGIETGMIRRDGTPVWVIQNMALIDSPNGEILEATMFDITQRRITEEQLDYQTHHDTLTGLANSILFERKVKEAISNALSTDRNAALLLIDIDEFKTVNDTIGHNVGNQLLQLVAYRLQKTLRDVDTVARLGGDEFTVILQSLRNVEDAITIAEKLRSQIGKPYLIEGHEIYITASCGIATCPTDGETYE